MNLATLGRAFKAAAHAYAGGNAPYPYAAVSANRSDKPVPLDKQKASPEHAKLVQETHGGEDAVGVWADGAELSRLVPHADVRDAAAWGLEHDQKSVLHWHPDPAGEQHLPQAAQPFAKRAVELLTTVPMKPDIAAQHFKSHGIEYMTVVPVSEGSRVHVIDTEGALHDSFRRAAGGAPVRVTPGTATFLGDWDDRAKGAAVFKQVLQERE